MAGKPGNIHAAAYCVAGRPKPGECSPPRCHFPGSAAVRPSLSFECFSRTCALRSSLRSRQHHSAASWRRRGPGVPSTGGSALPPTPLHFEQRRHGERDNLAAAAKPDLQGRSAMARLGAPTRSPFHAALALRATTTWAPARARCAWRTSCPPPAPGVPVADLLLRRAAQPARDPRCTWGRRDRAMRGVRAGSGARRSLGSSGARAAAAPCGARAPPPLPTLLDSRRRRRERRAQHGSLAPSAPRRPPRERAPRALAAAAVRLAERARPPRAPRRRRAPHRRRRCGTTG